MIDGILILDKDEGVTSRHVDNQVGHLFGTRHVGHLGTLDPFATGLLVVAVGKGNKFLPYLSDGRKTYIASLKLGTSTSTGDPSGEVLETKPIPRLTDRDIADLLKTFLGKSMQVPPMTSAIKVNGEALYKKAHRGEEIERKPRVIEVFEISMLLRLGSRIDFLVTVSSGTYIRVLAEDIAKKLGTVGHLTALRRIKVGDIDISKAKKLSHLSTSDLLEPTPYVDLPHFEVNDYGHTRALNGMKLTFPSTEEKILVTYQGKAVAVYAYKEEDQQYHCFRGLF